MESCGEYDKKNQNDGELDSEDIIVRMPPGSAIYRIVTQSKPHVEFLARAENRVVRSIRGDSIIMRSAVFYGPSVAPVVIMFQAGKNADQLFEIWLNFYGINGQEVIERLAGQNDITFHFYGDKRKIVKTVTAQNEMGDYFAEMAAGIRKLPPWSLDEFNEERDSVFNQYLSPGHLWGAINKGLLR